MSETAATISSSTDRSITLSAPCRPAPGRRARRIAEHLRYEVIRAVRRVTSAVFGLQWRFDVTVLVDAVVEADDAATAAHLLYECLRWPTTRLDVLCPPAGKAGWRDLFSTSAYRICEVTVDADRQIEGRSWQAQAIVTASFTLPARDADAELACELDAVPAYATAFECINVFPVQTSRLAVRRAGGKHR